MAEECHAKCFQATLLNYFGVPSNFASQTQGKANREHRTVCIKEYDFQLVDRNTNTHRDINSQLLTKSHEV